MRNIRSRFGFIPLVLPVAALALVVALVLIWGPGRAKQASAHFPHPGVDFSIGVGTQCDSTDGPTKCTFNPGGTFTVNFRLNTLPAGFAYASYNMVAFFAGVDILPASLVQQGAGVWPSCALLGSDFTVPGSLAAGCGKGIGAPASSYTGVLMHVDFKCPSTAGSGTIVLFHFHNATDLVDGSFVEQHGETEDSTETLTINCANPVGGISLDPQVGALPTNAPSSSGSDAGLPTGAIAGAMAVVVITGGVWYARRRRVR